MPAELTDVGDIFRFVQVIDTPTDRGCCNRTRKISSNQIAIAAQGHAKLRKRTNPDKSVLITGETGQRNAGYNLALITIESFCLWKVKLACAVMEYVVR